MALQSFRLTASPSENDIRGSPRMCIKQLQCCRCKTNQCTMQANYGHGFLSCVTPASEECQIIKFTSHTRVCTVYSSVYSNRPATTLPHTCLLVEEVNFLRQHQRTQLPQGTFCIRTSVPVCDSGLRLRDALSGACTMKFLLLVRLHRGDAFQVSLTPDAVKSVHTPEWTNIGKEEVDGDIDIHSPHNSLLSLEPK